MKKRLVFDLFQDLLVGLAITLTVGICLHSFTTFWQFVLDWLLAFAINYATGLLVPTGKIAGFLAKKMKLAPESKGFALWITAINSFVYVTVISLCMFVIKIGFNAGVWAALEKTYPFTLVVAFVVGFFAAPLSQFLTDKLIKEQKND